jgi:hypothetical protein
MNEFWVARLKNGAIYVVASVFVVVLLGVGVWKLFIQKTFTQKTVIEKGGTANYWWKDAQIKVGFGGCATFKADKPKTENSLP